MKNPILRTIFIASLLTVANAGMAEDRDWEGEAIANVETIGCYTYSGLVEVANLWNDGRYKTALSTRGCQTIEPGQLGMIIRGNDREEFNGMARFLQKDGTGDYLLVFRMHFDPR